MRAPEAGGAETVAHHPTRSDALMEAVRRINAREITVEQFCDQIHLILGSDSPWAPTPTVREAPEPKATPSSAPETGGDEAALVEAERYLAAYAVNPNPDYPYWLSDAHDNLRRLVALLRKAPEPKATP